MASMHAKLRYLALFAEQTIGPCKKEGGGNMARFLQNSCPTNLQDHRLRDNSALIGI